MSANAAYLELQGSLQAMQLASVPVDAAMPFHLEAEKVRVETDVQQGEAYGPYFEPGPIETVTWEADQVALDGKAHREAHRLVVFPMMGSPANVRLFGSAGSVTTGGDGQAIQTGFLPGSARQPTEVAADGLQWHGLGSVTLTGSFVVALWEWDSVMHSEEGAQEFRTGVFYAPRFGLPEETVVAARDVEWVETYVYVTNGTLTVPASLGALSLFLEEAQLHFRGDLRVEGTLLYAANGAETTLTQLLVTGDVQARFGPSQGTSFPVQLATFGQAEVHGDGQPIGTVVVPTGPDGGRLALAIIGLIAAVPGMAFLARRGYLFVETKRLDRAETALERGEFARAAKRAQALRGSSRYALEAELVYVESLVRDGRALAALATVREETPAWTNAPAMREYMAALAHAALGKREAAAEALARGTRMAPVLAAQARNEPLLRGLAAKMAEGYV